MAIVNSQNTSILGNRILQWYETRTKLKETPVWWRKCNRRNVFSSKTGIGRAHCVLRRIQTKHLNYHSQIVIIYIFAHVCALYADTHVWLYFSISFSLFHFWVTHPLTFLFIFVTLLHTCAYTTLATTTTTIKMTTTNWIGYIYIPTHSYIIKSERHVYGVCAHSECQWLIC